MGGEPCRRGKRSQKDSLAFTGKNTQVYRRERGGDAPKHCSHPMFVDESQINRSGETEKRRA